MNLHEIMSNFTVIEDMSWECGTVFTILGFTALGISVLSFVAVTLINILISYKDYKTATSIDSRRYYRDGIVATQILVCIFLAFAVLVGYITIQDAYEHPVRIKLKISMNDESFSQVSKYFQISSTTESNQAVIVPLDEYYGDALEWYTNRSS